MIILIVFCIFGVCILGVFIITSMKDCNIIESIPPTILLVLFSICLGIGIKCICDDMKPKPIDVYRGRTTLKITNSIIDSTIIKSDTSVIFNVNKSNFK